MWENFSREKVAEALKFRHIFLMTKKMLDIAFKLAYFSDRIIT